MSTDEIQQNLDIEEDELKRLSRDVDQKVIIRFRFHSDNYYEKQNDSIIICKEKSTNLEFAISFTDAESTNEFWEYIKKNNGTNLAELPCSMNADQFDDLQMPHLSKLDETLEAIDLDLSHFCQGIVYKPEFLEKLFETFDELEVQKQTEKLEQIHLIVKKLILSNEQKLIMMLMNDKFFYACLGAFEYKRGAPKENYRELQKNEARFKQIIEIKNNEILEKIHMNYRLQYIKDSVIASYIEESTSNTFNIIITRNNMEILEYIKERHFISELSEKFFDNLGDSIKFIGELLTIINNPNFQLTFKPQLVEIMNNYNFYKVFFQALKIIQETEIDKDLKTKQSLKLMEAITILANENKKELISFLFTGEKTLSYSHANQQTSRYSQNNIQTTREGTTIEQRKQYLALLSSILINEDAGLQIQVVEVFKVIFESMKNNELDDKIVNLLINDFFSYCFEKYSKGEINNQFINFVIQFLDLFQLAYKLSPTKFRAYVQKNQLIIKLFSRSDCNDKAIHLALVKLVRSLIVSDYIIISHLISNKIIDKIWEIYKKHERRSNLVNSTFQDMMHYLLVQNYYQTPKLFKYIMNSFGEELKARQTKILCFKKIVETYGQQKDWINQDRNEHLDFQNSDYLQQPHPIMEQIEEEKYFDSDDVPSSIIAAPQLDQKQQQERDKENMIKRQSMKERILKQFKNDDDDDDDNFKLIQDQKLSQSNNNSQNGQEDSLSSSSSLVVNMNTLNVNGESLLSSQNETTTVEKSNKLEICIDLAQDLDGDQSEDQHSQNNMQIEIEEKSLGIENIGKKKDEELKDDKCNGSILSDSSYSKLNSKRSLRQRDDMEQESSILDDHQNGENKISKPEFSNKNEKLSQIENKQELNHLGHNQSNSGSNYNNIFSNNYDDDEEKNMVKAPGEEVIQKKIKVD
ncbi:component of IIS longevity pathway SMK-1 protein (macronuclear) [Tetrahymena thermophila SB210]|uniref:Component of IIS longevity pathway SMK-1 protein n=1 Tax=Tetrahymena thermophila (strain SB210) TaxID=312017 RepID=I7MGR1_TETTS|nr:component of IIS longevity pathway SMK-1 protein [Tetrahymena thermophila SB210]EAR85415.3 component of IIS longevity pathway SMK-1 protein [Tetrahymena thermophila SB210]|eukprot:XP_001033078.3 component of IIS longevity pathway SMK-1 protein [Tetrahymena thermophila SB210]